MEGKGEEKREKKIDAKNAELSVSVFGHNSAY